VKEIQDSATDNEVEEGQWMDTEEWQLGIRNVSDIDKPVLMDGPQSQSGKWRR
jgi:hypothetical protein